MSDITAGTSFFLRDFSDEDEGYRVLQHRDRVNTPCAMAINQEFRG